VGRYFTLALLLIALNLGYALYALKEWRGYTEKFVLYRKLLKENMLLSKELERALSYEELLRYARRKGFKDATPEDVERFKELLKTGRVLERGASGSPRR